MSDTDHYTRRSVLAGMGTVAGGIVATSGSSRLRTASSQDEDVFSDTTLDGETLIASLANTTGVTDVVLLDPKGQQYGATSPEEGARAVSFELVENESTTMAPYIEGYLPGTYSLKAYDENGIRVGQTDVDLRPQVTIDEVTYLPEDNRLAVTFTNDGSGPTAVEHVSYPLGPFSHEYQQKPRWFRLDKGLLPAGATRTFRTKPFLLGETHETRNRASCGKSIESGIEIRLLHEAYERAGEKRTSLLFVRFQLNFDGDMLGDKEYSCKDTSISAIEIP